MKTFMAHGSDAAVDARIFKEPVDTSKALKEKLAKLEKDVEVLEAELANVPAEDEKAKKAAEKKVAKAKEKKDAVAKDVEKLVAKYEEHKKIYENPKNAKKRAYCVKREWYVVDAEGLILGRLASKVAARLKGKNKPTYTPNQDTGDFVIVINCDKVKLTGKKLENKIYRYHTGHVGGLKEIQYKTLMEKNSALAVYEAVRGMLPKNSLGRQMLTKLKVFKGAEHKMQAQNPKTLKLF